MTMYAYDLRLALHNNPGMTSAQELLVQLETGATPAGDAPGVVPVAHEVPGASPQEPGYVCPIPPPPWMNISSNPRRFGQYLRSSPRCHLPKMPVA